MAGNARTDADVKPGCIVFWIVTAILVVAAAAILFFVPLRYLPWYSPDISRDDDTTPAGKPSTNVIETRLTPRWAANGEHIVFESHPEENAYIVDRKGSKMTVLSSVNPPDTRYNSYSADLSPNSREVVYTTSRHSREELGDSSPRRWDFEIEVANIDGTGRRKLTNDTLNDFHPTWSPAGNQVAFVTSLETKGDLLSVVASPGNAESRVLARMPPGINIISKPLWSPDGKSIAFIRKSKDKFPERPWKVRDNFHLFTINLDGTGMRRVFSTQDPTPEGYEYTDSQRMVGTTERSQKNGKVSFALTGTATGLEHSPSVLLHIIQPDTGAMQIIPLETHDFTEGPTWGPEGETLLVAGPRTRIEVEGSSTYVIANHEPRVAIINLETGEEKDLGEGQYAAWSPDKSQIAIADASSTNYLVTVKPDGSDRKTLVIDEVGQGIRAANPLPGED